MAQFFFPQHEIKRAQAKKMFEIIVEKEGLELLGWRNVPVFPEVLGHKARECMPCIMQAFIKKPRMSKRVSPFDRMLYIARREFEQSNDNTYVVSMSSRTIVYKGMFLVGQLRTFFAIFRSRIMNPRLQWYIPVSVPTQIQAGREHIRTVSSYTTVRSTPSVEMPIRCSPERKIWSLHTQKASFTKSFRS